MKRFGLIGYPIAGSTSPALFTRAYNGKWPYDLIEDPDFESAWNKFMSSYHAVNVTAPYKEMAAARVKAEGGWLSEESEVMGAINIAVKTPEGLKGYNSDFLGVRKVLSDNGLGKGSVAIVAGYGGAGKAAFAAARDLGMDVTVCNRTRKAFPAAEGGVQEFSRPLEELPLLVSVADILIYTLPVPVPELEGLSCPMILEANYRTPCLENATEHYIHGSVWHRAQGQAGYPLMTGEEPLL